ncbi:MAG: ABC transporter substrate-binding protein [Cytophagales bacterium]
MMNKILLSISLSLIFACQSPQKKEETQQKKIASLAPSVSECLIFLDSSKYNFKICTNYDTSKVFSELSKINIYPFDSESLLLQKPDCVILLDGFNSVATIGFLKENNIGFYVQKAQKPTQFFESLKDLSKMLSDSLTAFEKVKKLEKEFLDLNKTLKPKNIMAVISTQPIYIYGEGSFMDEMVKHLTGEGLACPKNSNAYPQISPETVLELNPDVLVFGSSAMRDEFFSSVTLFKKLRAYQKNQILVFDENCMSRPSPSCVDCLKQLQLKIEELERIKVKQ